MKLLFGTLLGFLLQSLPAFGANFGGEWAYQALNSGDTSFKVEQEGSEITFYRVLHPEYEGKTYKLEHMYRGKISGKKIVGKMFVREEGMKDFEFLRDFQGEIAADDRMAMDDLVLKRQTVDRPKPPEDTTTTRYAKVIIKRDSKETQTDEAKPPTKENESHPQTASAPKNIPSIIPVSGAIPTEKGKAADKAVEDGDTAFSSKRYDQALQKYQESLKINPNKVEALYKLGWSYGSMGTDLQRAGKIEGAKDSFKRAIEFWERAIRFDPYNTGAKENIRRAKEKLQTLEYR